MNKNDIKPLSEFLDSLRDIEGFPIGKDEDILALSDPPYYTACPNPYIIDFIKEHGRPYDEETDDYNMEPFSTDIATDKNDPLSNAHAYPTKSPYKAIMQYINHYTKPGDLVLDCFCGSGMTGVASQKTNRKAILFDLSTFATFLAYNYNFSVNEAQYIDSAQRILNELEDEILWMYKTKHTDGKTGRINNVIYSETFECPICRNEFVLWDYAIDDVNRIMNDNFTCKNCNGSIFKKDCKKAIEEIYDKSINKRIYQSKRVPVLINYEVYGKNFSKKPDNFDDNLLNNIKSISIPYWFPIKPMMNIGEKWGDTWRSGVHAGITHVNHFFTKRNLYALSVLFNKIQQIKDIDIKLKLLSTFTSMILRSSKKAVLAIGNYFNGGGGYITTISGNLYIPSLNVEVPVIDQFKNRINKINTINNEGLIKKNVIISTQSSTDIYDIIPENSIDYIFVDPPFGANLMYSEINFINEAWLNIFTNNSKEAIINKNQMKNLDSYNAIMLNSFRNLFKILKPKRWITIEFHNSKSSVWNGIQEALLKSGFIIAQTSVLDKKSGSFTINVSPNSVKNDLIINAYKPAQEFESRFLKLSGFGLEEEFIEQFLENLPKQPLIERTEKMLYSKMLAYYIQRGYEINYNATTFYQMLRDKFKEKDGYWFSYNQIDAYFEFLKNLKLEGLTEVKQGAMMLFITDEKSALLWLYNFLDEPKTFSDIHTAYTKLSEISGDLVPDLKEMLEDNFIFEESKYRRPQNDSERLTLTEKRERELMREFESLLLEAKGSKKKIKDVRNEAILHGFEICYKTNRYEDILLLSKRLDRRILENNADINEFVEVAEIKVGGF